MSREFLTEWLHRKDLSQALKLMAVLSTFDQGVQLKEILDRAEDAGFKRRNWSNPSSTLAKTDGLAIHSSAGWELTKGGRNRLANLGLVPEASGVIEVALQLRECLARIENGQTREFVEEAVRCYEMQLNRSAIVMSWLAAVYVLQQSVVSGHLSEFNTEITKIDSTAKKIKNADDLSKIKESDFLDRLVNISLLSKSAKAALKECLDRRNGCGHPNSMKIGRNTVAHHIEILILNVFSKF